MWISVNVRHSCTGELYAMYRRGVWRGLGRSNFLLRPGVDRGRSVAERRDRKAGTRMNPRTSVSHNVDYVKSEGMVVGSLHAFKPRARDHCHTALTICVISASPISLSRIIIDLISLASLKALLQNLYQTWHKHVSFMQSPLTEPYISSQHHSI